MSVSYIDKHPHMPRVGYHISTPISHASASGQVLDSLHWERDIMLISGNNKSQIQSLSAVATAFSLHILSMSGIREVVRCFEGYRNYAPHSTIIRYQTLCTRPSSSIICLPISYTLHNQMHFQASFCIMPLY